MIGQARDLAKSDTKNDSGFNWCLVTGTAGSLIIQQSGGNQTTLANVPVGVWIPVGNATNILTSSTASGLMVA
jgi:hypothetical protein|tara:strand:+ start:130 stop:348 length:219 start_codon:yes stop_codon:yes gene_type:complete